MPPWDWTKVLHIADLSLLASYYEPVRKKKKWLPLILVLSLVCILLPGSNFHPRTKYKLALIILFSYICIHKKSSKDILVLVFIQDPVKKYLNKTRHLQYSKTNV